MLQRQKQQTSYWRVEEKEAVHLEIRWAPMLSLDEVAF